MKPSEFLLEPVPHDEAVDFIRGKPALASRVFGELLPELRARAFTIAGIEQHDTLQKVRDMVADIPAGADWDKTKAQMVSEISPFFVGTIAGYDSDGQPIRRTEAEALNYAQRRAELLLRLHGFQAYSASSYRAMDAQRDVFPFWKYQSMGDEKVRDTHAALDGKILPANSDFWKNHYPPWEWACRCQVVPMMDDEVDALRASQADRPLEERDVIEGAALARVEGPERQLVLGPSQIFDLRTQREKGDPDGYEFHPGDLRIPLSTLRARYDSAVWDKFEGWARAAGIPETGATVWTWLSGEKLAPTGKIAKKAEAATVRSCAELAPDLAAIVTSNDAPEIQRQKMHEALALPEDLRSPVVARNTRHEPAVEAGFDFIRQMVARSALDGPSVQVLHSRARACADIKGAYINGRWMNTATAIHELGHIIEHRNPAILAKSIAFRDRRTTGESPRWLGAGYGKNEIALEDQWAARGGRTYSGKVYRGKISGRDYATEILSMGIQRLYESPQGFYRNDPDYFAYVVDCIRGL